MDDLDDARRRLDDHGHRGDTDRRPDVRGHPGDTERRHDDRHHRDDRHHGDDRDHCAGRDDRAHKDERDDRVHRDGIARRRDDTGRRLEDMDRRLDAVDRRLLSAFHAYGVDPRVAAVARALSWSGEHGALWLAAGLAGAATDRERRGAWLRATALTATAHLVSMGVKRIVRRPRPTHVTPLVRTAGRHSFPSSHATSAAAAAVAYGTLGAYAVAPLAAAMCVSRLVVGVHHPTDVAAGAALGAAAAGLGTRWIGAGHG